MDGVRGVVRMLRQTVASHVANTFWHAVVEGRISYSLEQGEVYRFVMPIPLIVSKEEKLANGVWFLEISRNEFGEIL